MFPCSYGILSLWRFWLITNCYFLFSIVSTRAKLELPLQEDLWYTGSKRLRCVNNNMGGLLVFSLSLLKLKPQWITMLLSSSKFLLCVWCYVMNMWRIRRDWMVTILLDGEGWSLNMIFSSHDNQCLHISTNYGVCFFQTG